MADVKFSSEGVTITVRQSKTDQEGEGIQKGIPYGRKPATCPVRALRTWLEATSIVTGPVFRPIDRHGNIKLQALTAQSVALIVKQAAAKAGYDPTAFSGHSLRVPHDGYWVVFQPRTARNNIRMHVAVSEELVSALLIASDGLQHLISCYPQYARAAKCQRQR